MKSPLLLAGHRAAARGRRGRPTRTATSPLPPTLLETERMIDLGDALDAVIDVLADHAGGSWRWAAGC